ncbi:MAG: cobalamin-dependent protein [Rhodospirillales bacterium]
MIERLPDRDRLLADVPAGQGRDLLADGRALARSWQVAGNPYLSHYEVACEADRKRALMRDGAVALHAQIGYRDPVATQSAWRRIYDAGERAGQAPERYGICLDWSMGFTRDDRARCRRGTGLILGGPEEFAALSAGAPVAPHFGDFVLGFPAAIENTCAALAAGSTVIGNLGQYFTFRLPDHDDDVASTRATVTAIGLIAAQPVEMLVHSNLDDGFAAQFTDMASALGAVLVERRIVEGLCGVPVAHCFGHHFTDPLQRLAFQRALLRLNPAPGSMIYGATMGYRGDSVENYAALAAYLGIDILSQRIGPSGHAVNPVPVSENSRIPDIDEVIDAQRFAIRLIDGISGAAPLVDLEVADAMADRLVDGAKRFETALFAGLAEAGYDTGDAFEMLLALRRIGGRRLEELFGPGMEDVGAPHGRRPVEPSPTVTEIERMVALELGAIAPVLIDRVGRAGLSVIVASTDVHEHGKHFVEVALGRIGVRVVDGGVSVDPDDLARAAREAGADIVAVSTYNGVAASFVSDLLGNLAATGEPPLLLVGGRLNEIADGSNTSLPRNVEQDLATSGAVPCGGLADALAAIDAMLSQRLEKEAARQ